MAGQEPIVGPISMVIRADYLVPPSWPRKRRDAAVWKDSKPDADNIAKIVKDACNAIVYRDDAQIADLHVQKRYSPIAQVVVTVERLVASDDQVVV